MSRRWLAAGFAAMVLAGAIAGPASAHPLGNFTINHYAGLRIEPARIVLDVVVDEAEIPAFQSIRALDEDGDGELSEAERDAAARERCGELAVDLDLRLGGATGTAVPLQPGATGLTTPLGSSGIPTLRLECTYTADLATPIGPDQPTRISFEDRSRPGRLGWREIVANGDGVQLTAIEGELRETSVSQRLTVYPEALALLPLADTRLVVEALADAEGPAGSAPPADPAAAPAGGIAGPGGGGDPLPAIFQAVDPTPAVLLLSVLVAAALGAGHALTPGHGKTLMAAYLVGTRGRPLHAVGLGLSVSLSHTLGILVLAAIVVGAADLLPPDLVVRVAPVLAAATILLIGAWMLGEEWRRRRGSGGGGHAHDHDHPHGHDHDHAHGHDHDHAHPHPHPHDHGSSSISWRSLFLLGLAGGLIPSTSALLILLGSIAAGRPAFGIVLVVAFGLGMAGVMAGIGLVIVLARERLERLPGAPSLRPVRAALPLLGAAVVFGFGILLTARSLVEASIG